MKKKHRTIPAFNGVGGGFIKVKRSRSEGHVTLWVEGRDQDGPSIAGLALDIETAERFLTRFTAVLHGNKKKK